MTVEEELRRAHELLEIDPTEYALREQSDAIWDLAQIKLGSALIGTFLAAGKHFDKRSVAAKVEELRNDLTLEAIKKLHTWSVSSVGKDADALKAINDAFLEFFKDSFKKS